jgi:hypothetical protein
LAHPRPFLALNGDQTLALYVPVLLLYSLFDRCVWLAVGGLYQSDLKIKTCRFETVLVVAGLFLYSRLGRDRLNCACCGDSYSENRREAIMTLRKRALGLSFGVVWGLAVFVVTLLATMRGRGQTLSVLGGYYLGFTVSYLGALFGLVWGFITGFIGGVLIAWFYDFFCNALYKSEGPNR